MRGGYCGASMRCVPWLRWRSGATPTRVRVDCHCIVRKCGSCMGNAQMWVLRGDASQAHNCFHTFLCRGSVAQEACVGIGLRVLAALYPADQL